MRQRRGSVAFRINTKSTFPDSLPRASANHLKISSTISDDTTKTDQHTQDEPSPVPMFDTNFLSNQKGGFHMENPDMPIDRMNSANPAMKTSRGNSTLKSEPISHAKGSTACTIQ